MAGNTLVGFYWREVMLREISTEAWEYLGVCVPIVVIGAPLGSVLGSHFHRQVCIQNHKISMKETTKNFSTVKGITRFASEGHGRWNIDNILRFKYHHSYVRQFPSFYMLLTMFKIARAIDTFYAIELPRFLFVLLGFGSVGVHHWSCRSNRSLCSGSSDNMADSCIRTHHSWRICTLWTHRLYWSVCLLIILL